MANIVKGKAIFNLFVALLLGSLIVLLSGCRPEREQALDKLLFLEAEGYTGEGPSQERINELKEGIREYQKEVERTVKATGKIGTYYRMLALEYIELEMYGPALEAAESALKIYPTNAALMYTAGVCAAHVAKAEMDIENRDKLLRKAEGYYKRAIELRSSYFNALYGLSVLYLFEMDKPAEAEPLVQQILRQDEKNSDALFLLARSFVMQRRIDDALKVYDRIIENIPDEKTRQEARRNREQLLREWGN